MLSVGGARNREIRGQSPTRKTWPAFSPGGHWIAYVSDEAGREEVYVRRYPGASDKRLVSTDGGTHPVWNPNGRELFYRNGDKMVAVPVETVGQGERVLGNPEVLFERRFMPSFFPTYGVTPDGQRFIDLEDVGSQPAPTELVVVQNWAEELKRLVPAN